MKKEIIFKYACLSVILLTTSFGHLKAQDSLAVYMERAVKNNPKVRADFAAYQASLQRVAPAGSLPDPELGFSFYLKQMEQVNGKEVGTLNLMQMFPWFGTLKAARSEMSWMANASYEKFRESSLDVAYNVQVQWYQLNSIQARLTNVRENIKLLKSLEEVALYRYKSPGAKGRTGSPAPSSSVSSSASSAMATPTAGGGMSGMGGASSGSISSSTIAAGQSASMGSNMPSSSMSGSSGGMSDVLRIQIERTELENTLETTQSQFISTLAVFNALLGRPSATSAFVPDTLQLKPFIANDAAVWQVVVERNPMLAMWKAERASYEAKGEMVKKMGYPMIGIGLEYMINSKKPMDPNDMNTMSSMNGMDMIMPMVKFTLPIYRKKYKAQLSDSKFMKQSAELQYQNAHNELQASFVAINLRITDASRKIVLYAKQRQLAQTTFELMLREFATSSVSLTDVLQVQRELLNYSLKQVESVVEYNTAVAEFEKIIAKDDLIINKR